MTGNGKHTNYLWWWLGIMSGSCEGFPWPCQCWGWTLKPSILLKQCESPLFFPLAKGEAEAPVKKHIKKHINKSKHVLATSNGQTANSKLLANIQLFIRQCLVGWNTAKNWIWSRTSIKNDAPKKKHGRYYWIWAQKKHFKVANKPGMKVENWGICSADSTARKR